MMRKIRVLVIDDERSARAEMKRLIGASPELELIGEAANADQAEEMIATLLPDVLFLDIQMPERSGFELLEGLTDVPMVIFITAFDRFAVKAFEVNALDYLLKPVRIERFEQAIAKLKERFNRLERNHQVFVRDKDRYYFVKWDTVYLIESMDNYVRIFFDERNAWLKSSLNKLEASLDSGRFFRCNRAQLINLSFISEMTTGKNGNLVLNLHNGQVIEVSERRSAVLRSLRKI
jgi:two-component system LytT family response regulator